MSNAETLTRTRDWAAASPRAATPSPIEIIKMFDQVIRSGVSLSPEETKQLKARVDRLTRPSWRETLAFPAYSGLLEIV